MTKTATKSKPQGRLLDSTELYNRYAVAIRICERIDGGVQKDPNLIEGWVKARTGYDDEQAQKLIEQHKEDIEAAIEEKAEGMWTGFKSDDRGHYIETRQVKAMFRESATTLLITKQKRGSRQIIQHGFEVKGHNRSSKIYLEPVDGETEVKIENEEKAIHVMTPQGPRSAIKRCDYVTDAVLKFEVWVLKTKPQESRHISENDLKLMLTHAQENGLGANRSQNSGKFDVIEFGPI